MKALVCSRNPMHETGPNVYHVDGLLLVECHDENELVVAEEWEQVHEVNRVIASFPQGETWSV